MTAETDMQLLISVAQYFTFSQSVSRRVCPKRRHDSTIHLVGPTTLFAVVVIPIPVLGPQAAIPSVLDNSPIFHFMQFILAIGLGRCHRLLLGSAIRPSAL